MLALQLAIFYAYTLVAVASPLPAPAPAPAPQNAEITTSSLPNSATTSSGFSSQASPTADADGADGRIAVALDWFPTAGPAQSQLMGNAVEVLENQYNVLGTGGSETTLYYSGPGFSRAGGSLVPVTDIIEEIVVAAPSKVDVYAIAESATAHLDCSVNAGGGSANCVALGRAQGRVVTQTVRNIPGGPTTIQARLQTDLPTPVSLPDLRSAATAAAARPAVGAVGAACIVAAAIVFS